MKIDNRNAEMFFGPLYFLCGEGRVRRSDGGVWVKLFWN